MIKLERQRTASAVPATLRGKKRIEKAVLLLEGTRRGKPEFNSTYWKSAKKQLKLESHGKCAYCEAPTDTVAHGDVEHFRPKSIYWWLAYCYDNYLYSCQICNQTYKSDNFPIHGTAMQIDPPLPSPFPAAATETELWEIAKMFAPDPLNDAEGYPQANFLKAAAKEKCGLIDPYSVDPEPLFKWVPEPVLKVVYIKPRNNKIGTKRAYEAAERFLGLNRDELLRVRWSEFHKLETFKDVLSSNGLEESLRMKVKEEIARMMHSDAPFAGMARYFVNTEWQLGL